MRVLVTGGAGFIGSHLVETFLEQGASVTVADSFTTGLLENLSAVTDRVTIKRMDIAHESLGRFLAEGDFDTIIHAAGNASIPASVKDPRRDLENNVLATQNLVEAVRIASPRSRVVNISSAAIYAEGSDAPMSEDHPREPISPYGLSKLAAEMYVTLYARLHGLRACNVRVFSVFGPRLRKQVVWDFMTRLSANPDELVIQGDGSERRNPTHVQNIADAIVLVAERGSMDGAVYNVGTRETVSIEQLAKDLASAMGLKTAISHSGHRKAGHMRTWAADITRLESLGYRQRLGYHDGLCRTVAWFRSLEP